MEKKCNKLVSLAIFATFFMGFISVTDLMFYKSMPFDHFVKYTSIERSDVCAGEVYQEIFVERFVRKPVAGIINSELFVVKNDPENEISGMPKRIKNPKQFNVFFQDDTDSELIEVTLPELEVGNYYFSELVTIKLPKGVEKSSQLDPQYFDVISCE